jgi:hypothetical protein
MVRTSLLSLATLALLGAGVSTAEGRKAADQEGFRVYSVALRTQFRVLKGVYPTPGEALRAAAELRAKSGLHPVEVTTGSEGKKLPDGRPALYHVYTRGCSRSPWQRGVILVDEKKVAEAVAAHKKNGVAVAVIHDYAPKEVFHLYTDRGGRVGGRLLGTYVTLREACAAAAGFRTKDKLRCEVTTGTKGQPNLCAEPTQYKVYANACRGGWFLAGTANDEKKALEVAAAQKGLPVEVVYHFGSK